MIISVGYMNNKSYLLFFFLGKTVGWRREPQRMRWLDSITNSTDINLNKLWVHALETEMTTHASVLAWRIPGTVEPGGLPSMGLHRVGHD